MKFSLKAKLNILATVIFIGLTISLSIIFNYHVKHFTMADQYIHFDRYYWYDGSVQTLAEDIDRFDSYHEISEYLHRKSLTNRDAFPSIIALDEYFSVTKGKASGAIYLGYFQWSYLMNYLSVIFLFYLMFIVIINVLIKKIEDSFKYVSQTSEDLNVSTEHHIEEKKLLGYIQSFFDPVEQISKSFLPKYKQDAFKDNHKKSVNGFANLINKYVIAREQELLGQIKIRNETRNKIAADLHDDIGSTLTKISHNSEIIKSSNEIPKIKNASEKIGHLSREMLLSFNDVIWAIDSRKDTMTDLVDHMYDLAFDLLPDKDIDVNFTADSFGEMDLDVEVRQNVYLIFKEALNNICKHSAAKKVKISLKQENSGLTLSIKDNGNGFDVNDSQKGNGLQNMQKRAEKIQADLNIDTTHGVNIKLTVKI